MIFINLYVLGATLYSDSTLLITDFSITPPTIFIDIFVDDEPVAREILANHLQKIALVNIVASCKNAIEAFNEINKNRGKQQQPSKIPGNVIATQKQTDAYTEHPQNHKRIEQITKTHKL